MKQGSLIVKCWLFIGMAVLLAGCPNFNPAPDPPDNENVFHCRLQPIVIEKNDGTTRWNDTTLQQQYDILAKVFAHTRLRFTILPVRRIRNTDLNHINNLVEYKAIQQSAIDLYNSERCIAVHFMDRLSFVGKEWGGMASYPSNVKGFDFGILISATGGKATLAHEAGHAWNLCHSWECKERFPDIATESQDDCVNSKCNIMNYCKPQHGSEECLGLNSLSESQRKEIATWMFSSNRFHALERDGVSTQALPQELPRTSRKEPVID